ncbi:hypothetical protein K501DRAFT_338877 [Backusella circina FSU 941]|nr:hypothetical protein K501DRAFT_338877 [Backusella circina FSU 941]
MKNLSTEILFIIFKYLHFKQRVQCAQTCRKWAAILQSGLHLETTVVVNPNSNSTYNAFMNKMESSSDLYRQQCRRLVMQCLFNQPCDYSKILKYFPNLTYLYLEGDDVSQADLELNHIFNLQVWRNKLSTIKIKGYGETFLQMLDSGTFNALTTLDVSSNVPSNYRRIHLISALHMSNLSFSNSEYTKFNTFIPELFTHRYR